MNIPNNLNYTKNHEWVKINNGIATVGITDYAQSELGDIIFIELLDVGTDCKVGDTIGTIEAVKTVADFYSPIEGRIAEINNKLEESPGSVNTDPYDSGWIIKLDSFDVVVSELLSAKGYEKLVQ